MKEFSIQNTIRFFPALISGILVVLSFPSFDFYPLAWIALVPLLVALWDKKAKEAFLFGFVFGLTYFFGSLYWIYHSINHYGGFSFAASILVVLLFCCYLSLYPALFAYCYVSIMQKTRLPALLIAPFIWVVLEFVRSYAFSGFPWSSIGYSQYLFLSIIQISDITGIYGISFLIVAVNGAITDIFLLKRRIKEKPLFPFFYTVLGFLGLVCLLAVSIVYGLWRLEQKREGSLITASAVQGNIEQEFKWEPAFQNHVMETHFALSEEASKSRPDIIVWPETAVPFYFNSDPVRSASLIDFQKNLDSYLLFGSVLVKDTEPKNMLLSNSAVLLDRKGKKAYTYDKIHLVPFGEYVPFRNVLFFIDKLVVGVGDYMPGNFYRTADTEIGKFGTLICYEIIFPGLVRKFYTEGGDFMVTITNDAWFGNTTGPYQHFSMAVFRAIENRKPVIRSANTGISGFIDSNGAILSNTELFTRKILTETIKTDRTLTFYTKYGDLFVFFCIVTTIMLIINTRPWR
jgi:apolipoprotein N-acyltransferase